MSKLILPEHVKAQQNKKKAEAEQKKREDAGYCGEEIEVDMIVAPAQKFEGRFAAVVVYEGFVSAEAAQDFLQVQAKSIQKELGGKEKNS